MEILAIDAAALEALAPLNAAAPPTRRLEPVALGEGLHALNADLLQDCAPGQTWEHYAAWLQSLPHAMPAPLPIPPQIE